MVDRVRIVVAGAGAFGREHLRVLSGIPGAEIAGIAEPNATALAAAGDRFGVAVRDPDPVALLDRLKPDGLIVATPGPFHVPLAAAALHAGIPVLVEKPVAMTAAEAATLLPVAAASRGFVLPGHILRFSALHRAFVDIARSPEVGAILSVTARRHRDDSHAARYADDPVLMTMIHDIDLALWITGAGVGEVLAFRRPERAQRSETLMTATGSGGAVWRLATAWTFPTLAPPPDRIEVVGENGSVELDVSTGIRVYGARPREIPADGDPDQPHVGELNEFVRLIRTGEKPRAVTLADAVAGLRIADAVAASLKTGGLVRA